MINLGKMFFGEKTDFKALLQKGAMVIDVRTPDEFRSGHVAGSVNIPLDIVGGKLQEIKSKNKPVITVCRSGARSASAADMMKKAGLEVYNGGGWTDFERQVR